MHQLLILLIIILGDEQRSLNPLTAFSKLRARREEADQERITQLSEAVVRKLCGDITNNGMVSLFHGKATGKTLLTEMYSAIFSSPKMPHLGVMIHRDHMHRHNHQLSLSIIEHRASPIKYRSMSIERDWDMPEGEFRFRYGVGGTDEGQPEIHDKSKRKVITTKEKIQFLEDILATEVDIAATEEKFGASYTPGGMRPHSFHPPRDDEDFIFSGYWVRDIVNQLPTLPGVAPELVTTSAPAIEA